MTHCNNWTDYKGYLVTDEMVNFNGDGDDSHETFLFERHAIHDPFSGQASYDKKSKKRILFDACKTAQKPYDICVVACLILAKIHFGENIKISSDGDLADWEEGVKLVKKATSINFSLFEYGDNFDVEIPIKPPVPKDDEIKKQLVQEKENFVMSEDYEQIG
jgi:hypothetical protein